MEYREFRASVSEDGGKLSGLAAPFNSETVIGDLDHGGWREEIAPGAFKKAIRESDTVLLCDHDMSKPLARVSAGTLTLREGKDGLAFDAQPADTTYYRDLRVNVQAGNKGGMSIGFEPVKDEWFDSKGEPSNRFDGVRRVIREVKLPEISAVTNPAYQKTNLFARDKLLAEREERAPKPYGNVKYADAKNGKYPIDTVKHIKAAWAYINVAKNAAKYPLNGVSLSSVKAKIKAAAAKAGIKVSKRNVEMLLNYCPRHGHLEDGGCGEVRCEDFIDFPEWRRLDASVVEQRIKKGTKKRVLEMKAELHQAMDLFGKCDVKNLPDEAQNAVALVSAAMTHIGHVVDHENVSADDITRSDPQKPETSTSADESDFSLELEYARWAHELAAEELGL